MIRFFRSFYGKLSAIFLLLLICLGAAQLLITIKTTEDLYSEADQALHKRLAHDMAVDFAPVLKDKNADIIMAEIIASLEETRFEPLVITRGGKDGILASHSSNLRVFLDDARQKINSLVTILAQG